MLKLFLLLPFFTLNAALTLGLIYFTVFIDPNVGFLISFIAVISLTVALVIVHEHENRRKGDA